MGRAAEGAVAENRLRRLPFLETAMMKVKVKVMVVVILTSELKSDEKGATVIGPVLRICYRWLIAAWWVKFLREVQPLVRRPAISRIST